MSSLQKARSLRPWLVSVVVIRPGEMHSEILLLKRVAKPAGVWCQVAGKIESGETAWAAALRELKEETDLSPLAFYNADICEQFYEPWTDQIVIAPVFVAIVPKGAEVRLNNEHSAYAWLSSEQAISRVSFPGQKRMLREVDLTFLQSNPDRLLQIPLS
ncbi:NUDIX domain-containing protein [Aliiroseovarius crassostreae]|nr:NUDIX domain-containing protein [Aliiroseovarius crassostreae]